MATMPATIHGAHAHDAVYSLPASPCSNVHVPLRRWFRLHHARAVHLRELTQYTETMSKRMAEQMKVVEACSKLRHLYLDRELTEEQRTERVSEAIADAPEHARVVLLNASDPTKAHAALTMAAKGHANFSELYARGRAGLDVVERAEKQRVSFAGAGARARVRELLEPRLRFWRDFLGVKPEDTTVRSWARTTELRSTAQETFEGSDLDGEDASFLNDILTGVDDVSDEACQEDQEGDADECGECMQDVRLPDADDDRVLEGSAQNLPPGAAVNNPAPHSDVGDQEAWQNKAWTWYEKMSLTALDLDLISAAGTGASLSVGTAMIGGKDYGIGAGSIQRVLNPTEWIDDQAIARYMALIVCDPRTQTNEADCRWCMLDPQAMQTLLRPQKVHTPAKLKRLSRYARTAPLTCSGWLRWLFAREIARAVVKLTN